MNKSIARLVCNLRDEDCHIRFAAARTLGEIGKGDPLVEESLIKVLGDKTWFVRLSALQSIKDLQLKPDVVINNIVPLLQDEHEDIREYAALTIGDLGSLAAPAVSPLANLLSDPVWYVRGTVAWVLGQIDCESGKLCSCLRPCFGDTEMEVRISAVKALVAAGSSGSKEIECLLKEVAGDINQPLEVQEEAGEALKKIGSSEDDIQ